MPSFRKKPKAVAEIHVSPGTSTRPNVWLSSEDVCGCAIYTFPTGMDFSHSKISLRGTVTTRTDEYPDSLQRSWRTETLPFVGVTLDSTARATYTSDNGQVKIPFRFNLEAIFAQTQSTIITKLPPSVDSKDEAGGKWSGRRANELASQYDITYSITASVYSKKGLEASTAQAIQILPVSQGPPVETLSDIPGEYFFASASSPPSKISLTKTPSFALEVGAQEPEPIILDANEGLPGGSTNIPFVIKALPRKEGILDLATIPKQCQITAQLTSKTWITPDRIEEKFIPYINVSRFAKTSSQKLRKSDEQDVGLTLSSWNHVAEGSTDEFALANFSFDFNIAGNKTLPTFFTPLLSKRYAIDITINFPGSSSPSSKLSLPVQLVYEGDEFEYIKPRYP